MIINVRFIGFSALNPTDYFLHLRPRSWPIVALHFSVGFLMLSLSSPVKEWAVYPLAAITWVVLLNGGTLALNSVFDRDEGDVGYLDEPPPVPSGCLSMSLIFLFGGLLTAWGVGTAFFAAYTICLLLSLLYSVPPVRLKAKGGFDIVVNCVGYGFMTCYGGWSIGGLPPDREAWLIFTAFFFLFGGLYPLTQLYQMRDDSGRGDRTLAVILGRRNALVLSFLLTATAMICFFFVSYFTRSFVSAILTLLLSFLWASLYRSWFTRFEGDEEEKMGMYKALILWGINDIAAIFIYAGL